MDVAEQFLKFLRGLIICALALVMAVCAAHGQNSGTVGIQAQMISVFTAQSGTLSSGGIWQCGVSSGTCPVFQDIGQGLNVLFFCNAGNVAASYTIDFDFQPVGQTTFQKVTQASYSGDPIGQCHTLQLGAYFPNLRSTLTVATGLVSAWYSASSAPVSYTAPGLGTNGGTSPIACDQNYAVPVATGTSASLLPNNFTNGQTTVICGMTISFNAATSGGNIELLWASSTSVCSTGNLGWEEFTPASAPQYLTVPLELRGLSSILQQPCISNSSGATALVTVSLATVTI
jgi:hypothetical protein